MICFLLLDVRYVLDRKSLLKQFFPGYDDAGGHMIDKGRRHVDGKGIDKQHISQPAEGT